MKSLFHYYRQSHQRASFAILLLLVMMIFLLASCVPATESPILSPKLGAAIAKIDAGDAFKAEPTPTPVLVKALKPEQLYAGLPADIDAAIKAANPKNGPTLALKNGCQGCHSLDPNANPKPTGPTWFHLGDTSANRVPGESPAFYIYTSITSPSTFVVPDYPDNIMPKTFAETLSKQDIGDLIAYILEQHQ